MGFLDDEDDYPGFEDESRPRRGGTDGPTGEQVMTRRIGAAALGLLLIVLLAVGVRGCLQSRKEDGLRNYVRTSNELVTESARQSKDLFTAIQDPKNQTPLDVESSVKAERSGAAGLVDRAEAMDVPDEMSEAHDGLLLTLQLRSDALAGIADQIGIALGREGKSDAVDKLAGEMQMLLASDVIYARRTAPRMRQVIADQKITEVAVAPSRFLPNVDLLKADTIRAALTGTASTKKATPGLHGLGIQGVTINPGGIAVADGATVTVPKGDNLTLQAQVQNQGDNDESDVNVKVTAEGVDTPIEKSVATIAKGATEEVNLPLGSDIPAGKPVKLTVEVTPVPGEKVTDNNKLTATVTIG